MICSTRWGVAKQTEQPAQSRAPRLKRATPGLIVAALVWSLVFVLSVGTNGALAAALAQYLTIPPTLVDAFSSLAGKRDPEPGRDLTDLFVPSAVPEIDQFQGSGLSPLAGNGSVLASPVVAHVTKTSPNHGGLLGLDFMHALANDDSLYPDISAHPDAWTRGGDARLIGITDPVHGGRNVRGRSSERPDDGQAPDSHLVAALYANEPAIDSVPWVYSTPNTGPTSTPTSDKVVTLDDDLTTWVDPPISLLDDDVPLIDFVEPRLGVDFAQPFAALAATVPEPGTMGLLVGAFVAWPIAKRAAFGLRRRK